MKTDLLLKEDPGHYRSDLAAWDIISYNDSKSRRMHIRFYRRKQMGV